MTTQKGRVLNEEVYQKMLAIVNQKYGSQACDLEPLTAWLYFASEDVIQECLKAERCDEFMAALRKRTGDLNTVL